MLDCDGWKPGGGPEGLVFIARERSLHMAVMSIIRFKSADEVVDRANRTTYGLAARRCGRATSKPMPSLTASAPARCG